MKGLEVRKEVVQAQISSTTTSKEVANTTGLEENHRDRIEIPIVNTYPDFTAENNFPRIHHKVIVYGLLKVVEGSDGSKPWTVIL